MTATTKTVSIYAIDRDNGDGHYNRRYSFTPFAGPINIWDRERPNLVLCQDTDGGEVGRIVLPDGATADASGITVPGYWELREPLDADDATDAAMEREYGLRWQPI